MDGHVNTLISLMKFILIIFLLTVLGMSVIKILVVLLFPVAILKAVLAVMQGAAAWYNIGQIDIKEREEAAEKTE